MKKLHVFEILFVLTIFCSSLNGVYAVNSAAEINGTGYFDIHDAVAAAKNGDVIQILKSVEINEPIVVSGKHISIISVGNNVILRNENFLGNMIEVEQGASLSIGDPLAISNKNSCFKTKNFVKHHLNSSTLTLDGNDKNVRRSGGNNSGSIILNNGDLALNYNSEFVNNAAYSSQKNGEPIEGNQYGTICNNGNLIVNGAEISNNYSSLGGGIFNSKYGEVVFQNGFVKENIGSCGAGIFNAGKFTLVDGEISKNVMYENGGGIFNYGDLIIKSGKISENVDHYHSFSPTNPIPKGCVQWINFDVLAMGGGVFNIGNCLIEGGEISNNICRNGGGIANYKTIQINSGIISGNTATALIRSDKYFPYPSKKMTFECMQLDYFGNGGGILNVGNLQLGANVQIKGNQANIGSGIFHRFCRDFQSTSLDINLKTKIKENLVIPMDNIRVSEGRPNLLSLNKDKKEIVELEYHKPCQFFFKPITHF